jgi:hypothetical protein
MALANNAQTVKITTRYKHSRPRQTRFVQPQPEPPKPVLSEQQQREIARLFGDFGGE